MKNYRNTNLNLYKKLTILLHNFLPVCDGAEWKYSGRLDNQETKGRQQKQPGRRQSMTANEILKSNFLLSFHLLNQ